MIKNKLNYLIFLVIIITLLILFPKVGSTQYYKKAEESIINYNKYLTPKISSISQVLELFNKSLDNNTDVGVTKQFIDSLFSINKPVSFIDSCNSILKIVEILEIKNRHTDILKLLEYFLAYIQNKNIENREYYLMLAKTELIAGNLYQYLGLWFKAIYYFNDALGISESQNDQQGIAHALNGIGVVYFRIKDFQKMKENLNDAIKINRRLNNKIALFKNYSNLAVVYIEQRNYSVALDYYFQAKKQLDSASALHTDDLSKININISDVYRRMGEMNAAIFYINEAQKYIRDKLFTQVIIYLTKVEIYQQLEIIDSCSKYLEKSISLEKDLRIPNVSKSVAEIAYKYFYKIGDLKSAYDYLFKLNKLNDSIENINKGSINALLNDLSMTSEVKLGNYILNQKLNYEYKNSRQNIIWGGIILAILFSVIVLFALLLKSRKRELKALSEKSKIQEMFLQQEKQTILKNKEDHAKEIGYMNRQLTSYTLQLARDNQVILKTIKGLQNVFLTFKSHDSKKRNSIQKIINDLRHFISGHNWEEFRLYFEEINPSFYSKLSSTYPKLTPNELKLCAIIKLGLSNKDIASILFREVRSIESARNRLRKKLNLEKTDSLFDFLSKF